MEILILVVAMIVVGLVCVGLAGVVWKRERPYGISGDILAASLTAIIVGLIDWYVIPAMGFSDTMKFLGILFEPLLAALLILWAIRRVRK